MREWGTKVGRMSEKYREKAIYENRERKVEKDSIVTK